MTNKNHFYIQVFLLGLKATTISFLKTSIVFFILIDFQPRVYSYWSWGKLYEHKRMWSAPW